MRYSNVEPTGRRLRWPYVLFILLAVTLAVGIVVVANAAEPTSALIEFTSPEDFQAKLDSIKAVCDTGYVGYSGAFSSGYMTIIAQEPTIRCRTHVWAAIIFFSGNKPKAYVAWEWEER